MINFKKLAPGGSVDGSGNQRGFSGYANVALGLSSLIKGIANKRPSALSPARYTANVRPAQGFDEATQRLKSDITASAAGASRDVNRIAGSDARSGIAARLGINANANKAISDVEFKNAEAFRQDQNRVSDELNKQELINTQLINQAKQVNFQVDQDNFNANRAASSEGVRSALQYEANREADLQSKRNMETQSNQQLDAMDKAYEYDAYNKAISRTGDPDAARAIVDGNPNKGYFSTLKTNIYGTGRRGLFGRRIQD